MSKTTTMKKVLAAGLIFILAAAVFVSAGAATSEPTLGIELEYGDYNAGNYTGYVVLTGITDGDTFKSAALNLTTTDGVIITNVQKTDELKVTPSVKKISDTEYHFNLYTSGKAVKDGVKIAKFTVNVAGASSATEANINLGNYSAGDSASTLVLEVGGTKYGAADVTFDSLTLKAANPHSFADDTAIEKSLAVEDYLVRDDLEGDFGKVYSELGQELELSALNLSVIVNDPLSTVYIKDDAGNLTSVTGLNVAAEKAVGTLGVWNDDAAKLVDTRDITFEVTQKTDLENTAADPVVSFTTDKSYVVGATSVKDQVKADLAVLKHNIGNATAEGFDRAIVKGDLVLAFEKDSTPVTGEITESGTYNFTVTVPESANYAETELLNTTYYTFKVNGEAAPVFAEIGTEFDSNNLLKIGKTANMSMTYTIEDYANVKLANVTAVKKFYVNKTFLEADPAPEHVASLLLPTCTPADSSFEGKYTYDTATGAFTFNTEDDQKVTANGDYVFYFTSVRKIGDVDNDGYVNVADSSFICKKLVEDEPDWSAEQIFYGKTTGGYYNPTVLDALRIAQFDLGVLY